MQEPAEKPEFKLSKFNAERCIRQQITSKMKIVVERDSAIPKKQNMAPRLIPPFCKPKKDGNVNNILFSDCNMPWNFDSFKNGVYLKVKMQYK